MKKILSGLMLLLALLTAAACIATAEEAMSLNTPKTVEITLPGDVAVYQFTPEQTGVYSFWSSQDGEDNHVDTYGYLLDGDRELITKNDDGGEDNHFSLTRRLDANKTYYFAASLYSSEATGTFRIELAMVDGVYAMPKEGRVYVPYGKTGTVEAEAISSNGGLTYQWYDGDTAIEGATGSKYTFPALTQAKTYRCIITDSAENTAEVSVDALIYTGLDVYSDNSGNVAYGSSKTLKVYATAAYGGDQLTYQWYENTRDPETGDWNDEILEGETGDTLTLTSVTRFRSFSCEVTDINGDSVQCWASVGIDGENARISLSAVGETEKTAAAGSSVTMAVTAATEYTPVSYYWNKVKYYESGDEDWQRIAGANDASFTLANVTTSGDYVCEAFNSIGYSDNIHFRIDVTGGLELSEDSDTDITMSPSETKLLKVKAEHSTGTVNYRWYRYEQLFDRYVPIPGATGASYELSGSVRGGTYRCTATDETGAQSSVWFEVTVSNEFSAQPESETELSLSVGETAELKVKATGSGVSYRWYERRYVSTVEYYTEFSLIEDEQTDSLTITCDGKCEYECVVFDPYGNRSIITFQVQVDNGFSASVEQTDYTVDAGGSVTLAAEAECTSGSLTYRWTYEDRQYRSRTIQESEESSLTVSPVGADNYGQYHLKIYDEYGNAEWFEFRIAIENHFSAEAVGTTDVSVKPGSSATLAVAASCDAGTLSYQWFEQRQSVQNLNHWYRDPLPGKTQAALELTNIQKAASYFCQVRDEFGGNEEIWFSVTVDNELTAEAADGMTDFTVEPGESVTMTVEASCTSGVLTYQWYAETDDSYWEDQPIAGETDSSYTIENADRAGSFVCRVKDTYGNERQIWFQVYIENGLQVQALNNKQVFYVSAGEAVTLAAEASCATGDLTYRWRMQYRTGEGSDNTETIAGATAAAYTTGPVSRSANYYCDVTDDYGNRITIVFSVYPDSGLTVIPVGTRYRKVAPETDVTLAVNAVCESGELTYAWYSWEYYMDDNGTAYRQLSDEPIPGETGSSFIIENITLSGDYRCTVEDEYGATKHVDFTVSIDNGLEITGSEYVGGSNRVPYGGQAALRITAACATGDIQYQWYTDNNDERVSTRIDGATGSSFTSEPLYRQECHYWCTVTDDYGNTESLWFTVYTETGLTAEPDGGYMFSATDAPVTMTVHAENYFPDMEISYTWYDENGSILTSGTENSCTLESPDPGRYWCGVSDGDSNVTVYFYIAEEPVAYAENSSLSLRMGETAELKVIAWNEADDLVYQWYEGILDPETGTYPLIEGAAEPTLSVTVSARRSLFCHVSGTGLDTNIWFNVSVRNDITIDFTRLNRVNLIPANGSLQLTVNADSELDTELTWRWEKDGQLLPDENSATLTVTEAGEYHFIVNDNYGNGVGDTVYCVSAAAALNEGQTVTGPERGLNICRISPARSGMYLLEAEGWIPCYRADRWDAEWYLGDDSTLRMEAGTTYYIMLSSGDSFRYSLVKADGTDEPIEYTVTVPTGLALDLPWMQYINGKNAYLDHVESSDQSTVRTIDERQIELRKGGTADVTVIFRDGLRCVYHMTVTTGNTLTLPGSLQTIEADAFSGVMNVKFIRVGSNVQSVQKGAFANMGTICLILEGGYISFEGSAFTNSSPAIICMNGGNAEDYSRNLGIPVFYAHRD